jgi:hypothetical protein
MLIVGMVFEKRLNEGTPLDARKWFSGWSRPFYLFLVLDIFVAQFGSLSGTLAGMWVSLAHAVLIAVLASAWKSASFSYFGLLLGAVALFEWRAAGEVSRMSLPVHLAALALGYGALGFGYGLLAHRSAQTEKELESKSNSVPGWHSVWEIPLQRSGMLISFLALGLAPILGIDLLGWSVRALLGLSFRDLVEVETVQMVVWVLSLLGLLYAAASAVYRRLRFGYLAGAMLLTGWFLYAYYINIWENLRHLQWYVLLMGSLFWQTLVFGWWYFLTLSAEGFVAFWWGSARRLRRFFYAGMAGVILATLGQLLNALQEVNQWITFGLIGLILVILAIIVERRLDAIKAWQQVLETWE